MSAARETPSALGFRLPAEWEPHEATWLGWPQNPSDWPGKFPAIQWVYTEIVRNIVQGEIVRILVNSAAQEARARRRLRQVGLSTEQPSRSCGVEFFRYPTNRGWTRDFGPIFLRRGLTSRSVGAGFSQPAHAAARRSLPRARQGGPRGSRQELAVVKFRFNGWARYPDWQKDDAVAERAARTLKLRVFRATARGRPLVLEGGAIEVNGRGTLLATEECLLSQATQARNPGLGRKELETLLRDYLGVTNVLWLGRGIAGDDTHGHVDDLCRFVSPRRVVLCREENAQDENYRALEENRERLEGMRLEDGSKIEVIPLPMPAPLYFQGQRLPASYANFYISNAAVLVPTFNDPKDRIALGILAECFPERPVVGIHSVDLVWGLGTLHCLTQQQPAVSRGPGL